MSDLFHRLGAARTMVKCITASAASLLLVAACAGVEASGSPTPSIVPVTNRTATPVASSGLVDAPSATAAQSIDLDQLSECITSLAWLIFEHQHDLTTDAYGNSDETQKAGIKRTNPPGVSPFLGRLLPIDRTLLTETLNDRCEPYIDDDLISELNNRKLSQ